MARDGNRRFRAFPPTVASVPVARHWAHRVLSCWGLGASDAELAFNEMIANAVVHGSGDVHAHLTRLSHGVRLEVHDQGGSDQVVHHPAVHDQPGGRGLEIIMRVSTNWGWSKPTGGGTTVWALVPKTAFSKT